MRKLLIPILLLSLTTGCATTDYRVNGQEPKVNNTLQIVGTVVALGLIAKGVSPDKGKVACKTFISTGLISAPTTVTTYQNSCP